VRIKPEAAVTEKGDSPPYVVVYVLNQESGAEEAIVWEHITRPDAYKDLVGLSIGEWYRTWLQYALVSKGVKKIFNPVMQRTA
jgi:ABC-type nitrate/sulfonate/bicarbonate transport system substrate-binding protein